MTLDALKGKKNDHSSFLSRICELSVEHGRDRPEGTWFSGTTQYTFSVILHERKINLLFKLLSFGVLCYRKKRQNKITLQYS